MASKARGAPLGVVVFNHGLPSEALRTRDAFAAYVPSVAFDSGSRLTDAQEAAFDATFENIYYAGLINEACAHALERGFESVLIVCSDVAVGDVEALVDHATRSLSDPEVAVYAPAMDASSHRSMLARPGKGVRDVAFVEGVCFAVRTSLLAAMCPVDVRLNRIGWGLDVQLGFLAHAAGLRVLVDDAVCVRHPVPSGYDKAEAKRQRDAWFETLPASARAFRLLSGMKWAHTPAGAAVIRAIPWGARRARQKS